MNEENAKEVSTVRKVILGAVSVIFIAWFLASIGAMIYFSKNNMEPLVVTVFGQFFLVFGIIAVIAGIKDKNFQPIVLIFPVIGIGCIVGSCIFQFGSASVVKYVENALPYVFLCVFFFVGMGLVASTYFSSKRRHETCTYCIMATCVDLKTSYHKGTRTYCPVYEIYFRDETHLLSNNIYNNVNRVKIGEQREIYVNPDNPKEFYEPKEEKAVNIFSYVLGSLFAAAAVFALVMVYVYA